MRVDDHLQRQQRLGGVADVVFNDMVYKVVFPEVGNGRSVSGSRSGTFEPNIGNPSMGPSAPIWVPIEPTSCLGNFRQSPLDQPLPLSLQFFLRLDFRVSAFITNRIVEIFFC